MTTRAYVQPDYNRFDGLAIHVVQERSYDGARVVSLLQPTDLVWADTDPRGVVTEPSLRIPEDMARALLDALSAHFGGTTDVRSLRKDYDAERARVDRLIAHLTAGGQA